MKKYNYSKSVKSSMHNKKKHASKYTKEYVLEKLSWIIPAIVIQLVWYGGILWYLFH